MKVRKVNKTRSIIGEFKIFQPVGNEVTLEGLSYKKQGNEYRLMPYKLAPQPFCDVVINDEYGYPDFAKGSDLPEDIANNCPLQPGNYSFRNSVMRFEKIPKTILPSGDYAIEAIWIKDQEVNLSVEYGYPDFAKGSDFPEDIANNCPLQPGTYVFRNVVLKLDKVPKTILPSGDYAIEVHWIKNEVVNLKFRIYFSVVQV